MRLPHHGRQGILELGRAGLRIRLRSLKAGRMRDRRACSASRLDPRDADSIHRSVAFADLDYSVKRQQLERTERLKTNVGAVFC